CLGPCSDPRGPGGFFWFLLPPAPLRPAPAPADLGQASPLSVAVASTTGDEPCWPGDGCGHDHAQCCLTASVAIAAPDVALHSSRRASSSPIVESDANRGSGDPLSPFHPPKLLANA